MLTALFAFEKRAFKYWFAKMMRVKLKASNEASAESLPAHVDVAYSSTVVDLKIKIKRASDIPVEEQVCRHRTATRTLNIAYLPWISLVETCVQRPVACQP